MKSTCRYGVDRRVLVRGKVGIKPAEANFMCRGRRGEKIESKTVWRRSKAEGLGIWMIFSIESIDSKSALRCLTDSGSDRTTSKAVLKGKKDKDTWPLDRQFPAEVSG